MRLQDLLKRADQNKNQPEHLFNIEHDQKILLTEEMLRQMHQALGGTGSYRKKDVIQASPITLPEASEVPRLVAHFMSQLQISKQMFHPIEYAAICHKRILELCPFEDKNEEVAFLVLNLLLSQAGYQSIVIRTEDRKTYEEVLIRAQHPSQPDIDGFFKFIAMCVIRKEEDNLLNGNKA